MSLPPFQPNADTLNAESDDALERLLKTELHAIEHEEITHAQEYIEDLLMQQPGNHTFIKAISALSELDVLRSKNSIMPRLQVLAWKNFMTSSDVDAIANFLPNESITKLLHTLVRVLAVLRNRSDFIVPS